MEYKNFVQKLGFLPKENTAGIFCKKYSKCDDYIVEVDFENNKFNFGKLIVAESKTTQNFSQVENWVVLECVNRLLEKGYLPKNIVLEKTWATGHGTSGRLDILVTQDNGSAYLMIECKTYEAEFDKEFKRVLKDGGQLFTYFQQDKNADVLMLYASELDKKGNIHYQNEIIKIEDDYRQTGNVKDFYDRWNKLPKDNGVFDEWVQPYDFQSKALTPKSLKEIKQEDSSFIFNRFLEILRHNVVSDKPNAFNKIFTLFLCKIYDEKSTRPTHELSFQWLEGTDNHISFQKRLADLYKKGMKEFLEKDVSDLSDKEFEEKFGNYIDEVTKQKILDQFTDIRLKKNNEFAIKEVFDDTSFEDNAKVVKEVVELLQGYKIRYTKRHQYLSDFFELLLTTGLKQESGQFFTPVPVAQFIIKSIPLDKIVFEKLNAGEAENLLPAIIDYAAGSGHFLTESMHEIQRILDKENAEDYIDKTSIQIKKWQLDHFDWAINYVYGIEKDYRLVKVGKVGCYLHGDGLAKVIHGDGLANFTESKEYQGKLKHRDKYFPQENKQFDVLLSNPPYSVSAFKGTLKNVETDFNLYNDLTDQSSQIECLFIERTKQLLKDGGIAGIILPSSILSGGSIIYTKAREIILQYFDIVAIAELGSNTFMATGTNTVTLFLRRRKNEISQNIKLLAERFFTNQQDVTINAIEKPVSKYVNHVWEGISYHDYLTLLQKQPNKNIQSHEIYKEYLKKIVAKTEDDQWKIIIENEQEKLYYFILTYPQKIVLVKSGEKNEEKQFLGYEFSTRRGSEGIHPIQRGKNIDECTALFDPEVFDNPEKASTYIYKAFQNDYEFEIVEALQNNISRHDLVDLLTFDRVDFEKSISLAVKKKVKIESKCEQVKLSLILSDLQSGNRPKGGVNEYQTGVPSLGGEHIGLDGKINLNNIKFVPNNFFENSKQGILKNLDILICKDGALTGKIALFEANALPFKQGMINEHVFLLRAKPSFSQKFLFSILYSKAGQELLKSNISGQAQGGLNRENLLNIKIPFPPISIQEKIVAEIETLENSEKNATGEVKFLKEKIDEILTSSKQVESKKLEEVCDMKAGKFVSAYDIESEKTDDLFPCYGGNGLRGYTKTYTHDGKFSLIGRQGALCGNVCIAEGKFHATEHAVVVTPFPEVNTKWLYHNLLKMNLNQYATGTAQPGLSVQNLNKVSISVPSLEEQQEIVNQIETIENKIAKLEQELAEIPVLKEAVLKKYL